MRYVDSSWVTGVTWDPLTMYNRFKEHEGSVHGLTPEQRETAIVYADVHK